MKSYIEPFIASKALSQNSQKAYRYDLQQFCQLIGERVNQDKLLLYQNSIANLSLSAKKRKLSTANQFLYYLYQIKYLNSYFRLTDTMKVMRTEKQQAAIINTDIFYQKTPCVWGQLISLLILELGLTPSEVAGIEVANLDLNFQMLTLKTKKGVRVLPLSQILIPFLEQQLVGKEVYLFEHRGIPFSRQWFFNHLKTFVRSIGYEGLTAQKLREQFILKEKLAGKSIIELSDILGLKSPVTLEKYYKS
ncbi:TPA: site-specific tyrosine recombinase XerD [Streptococcus pyogenes]